MKTTTILATVILLALCTSAMAINITVQGEVVTGFMVGEPLQVVPSSYGPFFDFENIGVNPLIEIFVNYNLVGQTTVGAGQYLEPVNGMFSKTLDVGPLLTGDLVFLRAYLDAEGYGPFGESYELLYTPSIPPAPSDSVFDFGEVGIWLLAPPWPEPSILLTGLVLFLIRRKK